MHRHDQELALTERHDTGLRPQDRTQHLLFPRPDGARVQAMIAARAENRTRALHLVLQGDVSDAGFTGLICEMARAAGLSGWVHTTYRGAVQLHLQGDSQAVLALSGEVQTGLGMANVANVTVTVVDTTGETGFEVRQDNVERTDNGARSLGDAIERVAEAQKGVSRILVSQADRTLRRVKDTRLRSAIRSIPAEHLTELFLRSQFSGNDPIGCSFTAQMWQQTHFREHSKEISGSAVEDVLNDKLKTYAFADLIGARRPRTPQQRIPASEIVLRPGTVVKPENGAGSRGVYIVFDAHRQRRVADGREFGSYDALTHEIRTLLARGREKVWDWAVPDVANSWIVEELVPGRDDGLPPNDLKFYCFYGRAPLCLEVRRVGEVSEYCWWDRTGNRTRTGKYDEHVFAGDPLPPAWFDEAERISRLIPAPFMRIDFLRARDGIWLGEFTPRPGAFQTFDRDHDRMLGQEYVRAQARLHRDLMEGRTFDAFTAVRAGTTPHRSGRVEHAG